MNSVSGLDKRLQEVLTRPEFLEMRGVAQEVPIFIQTHSPADEDPLRLVVKGRRGMRTVTEACSLRTNP